MTSEVLATKPADLSRWSKIMIVGEAPGEQEERTGRPFVGSSGFELDQWLSVAGIVRGDCWVTNVFKTRPPHNDLDNFCHANRTDANNEYKTHHGGAPYPFPAISTGKYIRWDLAKKALSDIDAEIAACNPHVILALGNTALWALCGVTGISKYRGAVTTSRSGVKVIPSYHPAAVLRQYDLRPIAVADTIKAARESATPDFQLKRRTIHIPDTIAELDSLVATYLVGLSPLCFDIETKGGQITCIGFSTNDTTAVVIPFYDPRKPDQSFWSFEDERKAWGVVRSLMEAPTVKLAQNALYDIQYLLRVMGIRTMGEVHDTMMIHHAQYPEMQKDLGFLGSIYTNEQSWKNLRPRGEKMEGKKDE